MLYNHHLKGGDYMSTILNDEDYKLLAAVYARRTLDLHRAKNPASGSYEEVLSKDLNLLEGFYKHALQYYYRKVKLSEG